MRIVQLVDGLDYGGAEQVVTDLALTLHDRGHFLSVVCLRTSGGNPSLVQKLGAAGIEVVFLQKPDGFHLNTLRILSGHLKRLKAEIVHTHNHLVHHYGVAAGRMAGVRGVINSLHGTATLNMALPAKTIFWLSSLLGDATVCVCPAVEKVFRRAYLLPAGHYRMVENGIRLQRILDIPARIPQAPPILGTIGRLHPVKGYDLLLRAFALVLRKHPTVRLRILGDGLAKENLRNLALQLGLDGNVEWCGFSPATADFLSRIDLYVISSRSEGLPLTLLEAMSAGLPVVATSVGGIPDVVKAADCGWLCPPDDPEALAAAIRTAIETQEFHARGIKARQAARLSYSAERMATDYERIYEGIVRQ